MVMVFVGVRVCLLVDVVFVRIRMGLLVNVGGLRPVVREMFVRLVGVRMGMRMAQGTVGMTVSGGSGEAAHEQPNPDPQDEEPGQKTQPGENLLGENILRGK